MRNCPATYLAALLVIIFCSVADARLLPEKDAEKQAHIMLKETSEDRYDTASAMAANLISSYPDTPATREAYYVLGLSALHAKDFPKASAHFQTYIDKGGATTYQVRAKRYLKLLQKSGSQDKAAHLFFEGEFWLERNRPLKTLRLFREILKKYPETAISADAMNGLGYVYLVGLKNYAESLAVYQELLSLHPNDSYTDNAVYGMARSYELSGHTTKAAALYKKLKQRHALLGASISGRSVAAFNEYSRLWHRRASLGLKRLDSSAPRLSENDLTDYFLLGFGDRLVIENPAGSGKHYQLWQKVEADGLMVNLMQFTLNARNPVTWQNRQELLSMAAAGYGPVVIFQYFDVDLSPEFVKANEQQYYNFIRERLIPLLKDIPESYVLLEAEFNRGGVGSWAGWDQVAANAINIIHKELPQAKVGLTAGDWNFKGREELKISMNKSARLCDFIGYQFMISEIEEDFAQDPSGQLLDRILDFANFLKSNFNKPLLIGYLGISSYGGWDQIQAECLRTFFDHIPDLKHLGVFGMVYFSYTDDPQKGGWFGPAEQRFGIVEADGSFKPGWHTFKDFTATSSSEGKLPASSLFLTAAPAESTGSGFPITIISELSKPSLWRVVIKGMGSAAQRTFQGFGSKIYLQWNGDADRGRFGPEQCRIELATGSGPHSSGYSIVSTILLGIKKSKASSEKTIFAEGRSYEIAPNASGSHAGSEAYRGSRFLGLNWTENMAGTAFAIPFSNHLTLSAKDSISFWMKSNPDKIQDGRVILYSGKKSIPFALLPFKHRDAGNGWFKVDLKGGEVLNGYNWNSTSGKNKVALSGMAFQSLSGNNYMHVDEIRMISPSSNIPQSIIPYFQSPLKPRDKKKPEKDPGQMNFHPRRF